MAKYRVETTGGVYEVETADAGGVTQQAPQEQGMFGKAIDAMGTPGRGVAALAYGAGQLNKEFNPVLDPSGALENVKGVIQHPGQSARHAGDVLQTMSAMTKSGFKPSNLDEGSADVAGTLTNLAVPVGEGLTLAGKALAPVGKAASMVGKAAFGTRLAPAEQALDAAVKTVKATLPVRPNIQAALERIPENAEEARKYGKMALQLLDKGDMNPAEIQVMRETITSALNTNPRLTKVAAGTPADLAALKRVATEKLGMTPEGAPLKEAIQRVGEGYRTQEAQAPFKKLAGKLSGETRRAILQALGVGAAIKLLD
jgi:hypothetical protein